MLGHSFAQDVKKMRLGLNQAALLPAFYPILSATPVMTATIISELRFAATLNCILISKLV